MIKTSDDQIEVNPQWDARITAASSYARIARRKLNYALVCREKLNSLSKELDTLTGDQAAAFQHLEMSPLQHEEDDSCLIAIVFSALAVESYIYDYAARNLTDSFVKAHLDKLDVVSKWVVITRLVTRKDFPKDENAYQLLRKLIRNRNHVVHYKSVKFLVWDKRSSDVVVSDAAQNKFRFSHTLLEKAKEAIQALDGLALVMENLDQNEFTSIVFDSPIGRNKAHFEKYGC